MRGRPFQPGNKYGRSHPKGSRNKIARLSQDRLDSHAETPTKKCLALAYQGNLSAMRLCSVILTPAGYSGRRFSAPSGLPEMLTSAVCGHLDGRGVPGLPDRSFINAGWTPPALAPSAGNRVKSQERSTTTSGATRLRGERNTR